MALTDNILAYWNLNDDGSGGVSLVDSTGNGYTLTNNNDVTLGTGIIAGDAVFNGANYLSAGTAFDFSGDLSISFWAKIDPSNGGFLFSDTDVSANGLSIYLIDMSSGIVAASYGTTFVVMGTSAPVDPTAWNYYTFTRESGVCSLYLNGTNIGTAEGEYTDHSAVYGIGYEGYYDRYFTGQIDEVGVWNRALSQADVTALYNDGAGLTYPFALYYNNAEADGDWGNLLNWWIDSGFTIQATALPDSTIPVNLYNEVTQNTDGDGTCYCKSAEFYSASFYSPLVLNTTGLVNFQGTGGVFDGTCTDGISFHDTCSLGENGVVQGDATFRDSSTNSYGTINGNAFFYESSYNYGQIDGNATVYYSGGDGSYPIGGTITGSVTYLDWPAVSPQYFNDNPSIGGADDGDFNNPLNWWTDDNYNVRPINSVGTQQIPDASTDVFIAPSRAIYANTGTEDPMINSLTANNAELVYITITISNGATFGGDGWGMYQAVVYGNVTFNSGSYNSEGIIHGTAKYTSTDGLQYAWNDNSLVNLNTTPMAYGSTGFQVSISGGGDNIIARLLNLPWFINI